MIQALTKTVLAALLVCATAFARGAENEAQADAPKLVLEQAENAFWVADFAAMQKLNDRYKTATDDAGYQRLRHLRNGFGKVIGGYKGDGAAYRAEVVALTLQWARQHPQSALAHILHARALLERGWHVRGGGYARTVPPQAWDEFRSYVKQAGDYLAAHSKVAFTDSSAHVTMLEVARAADWPVERQWAIVQDAVKVNPGDRAPYYRLLTAVLPKWGGSAEMVDAYVNEVTRLTKDRSGMELYALLYAAAAEEQFSHQLFEDSLAKWPKMKEGYERRIKRDGDPADRNGLAYFACLAQDRDTFLEQMEALGDARPVLDQWGENAQVTYDSCKRWALKS